MTSKNVSRNIYIKTERKEDNFLKYVRLAVANVCLELGVGEIKGNTAKTWRGAKHTATSPQRWRFPSPSRPSGTSPEPHARSPPEHEAGCAAGGESIGDVGYVLGHGKEKVSNLQCGIEVRPGRKGEGTGTRHTACERSRLGALTESSFPY